MRLIVLECRGRLANLILCWANAVHVTEQMGLQDFRLVLHYDLPHDTVKFPEAIVVRHADEVTHLPRVTRDTLMDSEELMDAGEGLWVWEDVYSNFPPAERMAEIIRTIQVHEKLEAQLQEAISQPTLGVHVRHGDFEKWKEGEAKPVFPRASDEFYLERICSHELTRIFLASDGEDSELEFITKLPLEIVRGQKDNPIFDLLALSRCQAIIGSNSTFSTVAAYLGNIPLVTP